MSTLTVYETVLYSALLRLPREMSLEAKKYRTLETMNELGILGIKDSRIGSAGRRSISGGEKRRVSIACELVTSPSILFLDEPTSGLDAFNALSVVESLVTLARDYNRTVVFTIHQPRSNIVSLFDQLIVLAQGKLVYSGEAAKCHEYLVDISHPCPPGFNLAIQQSTSQCTLVWSLGRSKARRRSCRRLTMITFAMRSVPSIRVQRLRLSLVVRTTVRRLLSQTRPSFSPARPLSPALRLDTSSVRPRSYCSPSRPLRTQGTHRFRLGYKRWWIFLAIALFTPP